MAPKNIGFKEARRRVCQALQNPSTIAHEERDDQEEKISSRPASSRLLTSSTSPAPRAATTTKKPLITKPRASSSTSFAASTKASNGISSGTASSRTSSSSRSTTEALAPVGIAPPQLRVVCPTCKGLRTAELQRPERARVQGVMVERALVYVCSECRAVGDLFALPIVLGLRHAGMQQQVDVKWRVLDELDKPRRARPVLSSELLTRLDGLQEAWDAPDRSTIARWLVVARAVAVGVL